MNQCIYFIGHEMLGPIKIGMSRYASAKGRLETFQANSPVPLVVIHEEQTVDARKLELRIHRYLANYRLHGEWFEREAALQVVRRVKSDPWFLQDHPEPMEARV